MASPSSPAHPASTRALSSTSSPANQWACFPSATEVPAEYKISPRYTPVADLSSPVSIMTDAYLHHLDASASDSDELDSLPSISSSVLDSEPDSDAQAEWERSLEQMQLLLTMIIVPFAGKYFGRKFAYWSKLGRRRMTEHRSLEHWSSHTDSSCFRLGPLHGMDAQCRDNLDEQGQIQGCRCGRSSGGAVMQKGRQSPWTMMQISASCMRTLRPVITHAGWS